jgi:hypothetical protein
LQCIINKSYALSNTMYTPGDSIGGLFGKSEGVVIDNCYAAKNTLTATAIYPYLGGFGGVIYSGTIKDSYAAGNTLIDTSAVPTTIGSLIALNSGTVKDSYADGSTYQNITNCTAYPAIGYNGGTLDCAAEANCGGQGFNITQVSFTSLGNWDTGMWSRNSNQYPIITGLGAQQFNIPKCTIQQQGEGIPETSKIMTVVGLLAVIIVVGVLLFKKK